MPAERAEDYFEFLAKLGLTKHYGSLDATRELVQRTGIQSGQLVLDLGCGVGATPVFLAQEIAPRLVGADLIENMLHEARQRALRHQVGDLASFLAADARSLPFRDDCFDVVLLESVNVFFDDKSAALREYARVIKPGGYLGITEMTWLQPPTQAYQEMFKRVAFVTAHLEGEWKDLIERAGFIDVNGSSQRIDPGRESKSRFQRYGLANVLGTLPRIIKLLLTDRSSRMFFKDGTSNLSRDIMDYVGYGVFSGKKPC
ncbi:MAG: class I SAM-dependent methyltransferase [Anaerolineales bacterium]